ncbi:MAG TPA: flagellin [Bryobacteraceae bacterium]|nr:flagellin [Bryobacteraceae bacterium]
MSISFQTNIASMLAAVNLNNNNNFQTNTIEQLTSGYRINNSGDDAAGLAVANGYAANIAELTQGVLNGNDGVNTLQIIDGGLSNISTMLNRMQTLATESASNTFTGNRNTLNQEYQTLIGEINREAGNIGLSSANPTNATALSVFIGGGQASGIGDTVGVDLANGKVDATALGLSNTSIAGTPVTIGSAPATVLATGSTETFNVSTASGTSTIAVTGQTGDTVASQLARLNNQLATVGITASLDSTGTLAFSSTSAFSVTDSGTTSLSGGIAAAGAVNSALNNQTLVYNNADQAAPFTVTEGATTATLNITTGSTDTQALQQINTELAAQGITDVVAVATGTAHTFSLQGTGQFTATANAGATSTVGNYTSGTGNGGAAAAIIAVTTAVQLLGNVQGTVGAGENDLNYAIGLANSQITNFSGAESGIRDADVATEAANLTKAQVLEQASVAAMAQANSAPQVILSLLKSA